MSTNWTAKEDSQLRSAVIQHGPEGWEKIASKISQTSKSEKSSTDCQARWAKIIRPEGMYQGAWTEEEDNVIRDMVQVHGTKHWAQIAKVLLCRSGKQCRERWFNVLDPEIKRDPFSAEEDELILKEKFKEGSKWASIANKLPGRTDNAIKNRYNSTLRRVMTHAREKLVGDGEMTASQTDSECCWQLLEELKRQKLLGDGTKKLTSRPGTTGGANYGRPKNNTRNRGGLKVNHLQDEALMKMSSGEGSTQPKSHGTRRKSKTQGSIKAATEKKSRENSTDNKRTPASKRSYDDSDEEISPEPKTTSTRRKSSRKQQREAKRRATKSVEDDADFPAAHVPDGYQYSRNLPQPAHSTRNKAPGASPGSRSTASHDFEDDDQRQFYPQGGVATLARVAGIEYQRSNRENGNDGPSAFSSPNLRTFAEHVSNSPHLPISTDSSNFRDSAFSSLSADENELAVSTLHSKEGFSVDTPRSEMVEKSEFSTGGSRYHESNTGFSVPTPGHSNQVRSPSSIMSPGTAFGTVAGFGPAEAATEESKGGATNTDQSTTHQTSGAETEAPRGIAQKRRKHNTRSSSNVTRNGKLPPKAPAPMAPRDSATNRPNAEGLSSRGSAGESAQGNSHFLSPAEAFFRQSGNAFAVAPQQRQWSRTTPPVHYIENVGDTPNIGSSSAGDRSPSERAQVEIPAMYRYDTDNAPPTDDESERSNILSVSPSPLKGHSHFEAVRQRQSSSPSSRNSALTRAGATRSDIQQFSPSRRSPGRPRYVNNTYAPRRRLYDEQTSAEEAASVISASLTEET
eukprot:gb/GECG01005894.1/.p1 GENE.gb/GECG01005894.1/~~gb/GECG01005894.1/.p1  ORF type:complete len:797 (+),score=98.80 gb/GECG01005894.1/:1-2391(+)